MERFCFFILALAWLMLAGCGRDHKATEAVAKPPVAVRAKPTDESLRRFLDSGLKHAQMFTIYPDRDTLVSGAQGTQVFVPADAWDVAAASGPVQLRLREFYSIADMVLAGLSTTASGQLLETAGMLNLTASTAGQPVALRSGASLRLRLPTGEVKPGMQLFMGQHTGTQINWQADSGGRRIKAATMRRDNIPGAPGLPSGVAPLARGPLYYELSSAGLGWINCDRFLTSTQPLVAFSIHSVSAEGQIMLVLRGTRSVIGSNFSKATRRMDFGQLPQGARATVVAVRWERGKTLLALKQVVIAAASPLGAEELEYRPVTMPELRQALTALE